MKVNHEIPHKHHPFLSSSSENNIEQSVSITNRQYNSIDQMIDFTICHKDITNT